MRYLIFLLGLVIISCGSGKDPVDVAAQNEALDNLVKEKSFEMECDWANPLATNSMTQVVNSGLLPPGNTANRISLIGNSNYLKIMGDSVSVYLPYFGERRMGGGYNTNTAIEYDGVVKNMKVTKKDNKSYYLLSFNATSETENYDFIITIFPGLTGTINVNSSQRNSITYNGKVTPITKEDKDL